MVAVEVEATVRHPQLISASFVTIIIVPSFPIHLISLLVSTHFSFFASFSAFFVAARAFLSAAMAFFFFCSSSLCFLFCSRSNFFLSFSSCCFLTFSSRSLRMPHICHSLRLELLKSVLRSLYSLAWHQEQIVLNTLKCTLAHHFFQYSLALDLPLLATT